jgi:hypothetical protein
MCCLRDALVGGLLRLWLLSALWARPGSHYHDPDPLTLHDPLTTLFVGNLLAWGPAGPVGQQAPAGVQGNPGAVGLLQACTPMYQPG